MVTAHAEIAGGGLVGLSTALLLAKDGWSVRVHEQAGEVREIGAGISLHQGACSVLDFLDLMPTVQAAGVEVERSQALNRVGRIVADRQLEGAYRQLALPRQTLIQILADEAMRNDIEIVTSSRAVKAEGNGSLHFEDGTKVTADLVVGADGFHSAVRDSLNLTGRKVVRTNGATRSLISYRREDGQAVLEEWWGASARMGILPVGPETTYVYMSSPQADRRATQVPIDAEYWGGLFPGVDPVILEKLATADSRRDAYPYVQATSWSKGRAAIVGDAMSAVPPSLGLGASLGMFNARQMVDALRNQPSDVEHALRGWETNYRATTEWIQKWSLFRERLAHNLPSPLAVVRMQMLSRSNGFRGWGRGGRSFDEVLAR